MTLKTGVYSHRPCTQPVPETGCLWTSLFWSKVIDLNLIDEMQMQTTEYEENIGIPIQSSHRKAEEEKKKKKKKKTVFNTLCSTSSVPSFYSLGV